MSYPLHLYSEEPRQPDQPVICLGHGNGFPPLAYGPLAQALGQDYYSVCLPARPWWDAEGYRQLTDWHLLAQDIIGGIRQHGLAPVIGVGHSMSGVAMVYAAVQDPSLFRAIILVDPVFLAPWIVRLGRVASWLGLPTNTGMVQGALKRRREWPSAEDAFGRFRQREFFSRCSDEVLWLYTRGITRPKAQGDGVELAYPPEWEAQIFATSPYDEWAYPRRITRPCAIIAGQQSDIFTAPSQRAWQRLRPDIPITCLPDAGHLLPLERPQALAQAIRDFVATLPS